MGTPAPKSASKVVLSNILVRILSFCVLVLLAHSAYVITVTNRSSAAAAVDSDHRHAYYSSVFQHLIAEGFLSTNSNTLCITSSRHEITAFRSIGVLNSIAISSKKLTSKSESLRFENLTFDFVFTTTAGLDRTREPVQFASEVSRTLRNGGFFVAHTNSAIDKYSLHSLLRLFNSLKFIKLREINGLDSSVTHEIIFRKKNQKVNRKRKTRKGCSVSRYKRELVRNLEPLIEQEPLKPLITFRKNFINNVKYLSSVVDISFKTRYMYIDVGSRSYSSSIGNWFNKHYPKHDKPFEIFAIEANTVFHKDYKMKKGVTLLPYVAWIRNETLFFEINRGPTRKNEEKGRGVERSQRVQSSSYFMGNLNKIRGFDFAMWLKSVAAESDYVVVKMDVEGMEFELISRLIESGSICLIDEMFVECHYNRWEKGKRSRKYSKRYDQCLELFVSLRKSGVFVHQWW